jgi:hypothetical protein
MERLTWELGSVDSHNLAKAAIWQNGGETRYNRGMWTFGIPQRQVAKQEK